MKVYFHLNLGGFSNCYIVVNEKTSEALIIDPGKITEEIISRIEDNHLKLVAVLITHNHGSHAGGLHTLRKIYSPKILAADWEVAGENTTVVNLLEFIGSFSSWASASSVVLESKSRLFWLYESISCAKRSAASASSGLLF